MPIYEFRCEHCGDRFEVFTAVGTRPERCLTCRGVRLRLVPSRLGSAPRPNRRSGTVERMADVGSWAEARLADMGLASDPEVGDIIERGRTGALLQEVAERGGGS